MNYTQLYLSCGCVPDIKHPTDNWWFLTTTGSKPSVRFCHSSLLGNAVLHIATTPLEDLPRLITLIESQGIKLRYPSTNFEFYTPHGLDREMLIGACMYRLQHEEPT